MEAYLHTALYVGAGIVAGSLTRAAVNLLRAKTDYWRAKARSALVDAGMLE